MANRYLKGLPADTVTSLEDSGKADRLIGDQVAARLGYKKGPLKAIWGDLTPDQRAEIAMRLNTETDESVLIEWLMRTFSLSEDVAHATANIRLPDSHDHLGPTATAKVLEELKKDVIPYSEAVKRAMPDKHHSDERDGVIHDRLPFYGEVLERHTLGGTGDPADAVEKRYGRLGNPTVHVALNRNQQARGSYQS